MKTYEYKVYEMPESEYLPVVNYANALNRLGKEGWKLFSARDKHTYDVNKRLVYIHVFIKEVETEE